MDLVEIRLKELGAEVKRGFRTQTGTAAMRNRCAEANEWGADLYYVAHTNAGGGRYSMTMCYPDTASKKKANVFHKYRKCVKPHKVTTRKDLYEINATNMICLYDELFFHDNAEDCAWFHNGGMELMAEETVQALCELLKVTYKKPDDGIRYKVSVTAKSFDTEKEANSAVKKLKNAGFTGKITKYKEK
jgi:N-acetylmuramoyl-L-alanine amidase